MYPAKELLPNVYMMSNSIRHSAYTWTMLCDPYRPPPDEPPLAAAPESDLRRAGYPAVPAG